jgi:hypothetical protein
MPSTSGTAADGLDIEVVRAAAVTDHAELPDLQSS